MQFMLSSYNAAVAIYVTYSHSFSFAALVAEFLIWNSAVLASLIFAASTWHDATLAPLEVALSISNPLIAIGVYPAFAIEKLMDSVDDFAIVLLSADIVAVVNRGFAPDIYLPIGAILPSDPNLQYPLCVLVSDS